MKASHVAAQKAWVFDHVGWNCFETVWNNLSLSASVGLAKPQPSSRINPPFIINSAIGNGCNIYLHEVSTIQKYTQLISKTSEERDW